MFSNNKTKKRSAIAKIVLVVSAIVGVVFASSVFAAVPTAVTLSSIGSNVDTTVSEAARILTDAAILAGIGFIMASFFKFHQHKLNPQQIPLSQGITLILIGAGLLLFPTMLPTAKTAIFGTSAKIAQVGGSQIQSLIGS